MSTLRNLGTNNYFSSTSVCQLLLGFERWIVFTKKMGAGGASQARERQTNSRKQLCVYRGEANGEWEEMRPQSGQTDSGVWVTFHPVRGSEGHLLNQWFSNISTLKKKIATCSKMEISRSCQLPFPRRFRFHYPRAGPSNLHFNQHYLVPPPPTPALTLRLRSPFEQPCCKRCGAPGRFWTAQWSLGWQSGNRLQGARRQARRAVIVITELLQ